MNLIIPNYNQVTYLKNLINWFQWYGGDKVFIVDNNSTSEELLEYYNSNPKDVKVTQYSTNEPRKNLKSFLDGYTEEYYCLSDPDISPHPSTPFNFLELFKHCIDVHSFHHVGFNLITDDIPNWTNKRDEIIENERVNLSHHDPVVIDFEGKQYTGSRASFDTTFGMYKTENGWYESQSPEDWSNALRILDAFHLPWYIDGDFVNEEMDKYYKSCTRFVPPAFEGEVKPSALLNNNRPKSYE